MHEYENHSAPSAAHPLRRGAHRVRGAGALGGASAEEKRVALSFDAAWGNEDTQTLIDILSAHDVRATFFLVGQWVEKYPESVQALAAAGEEVMNHSETHPHLNALTTDEVQQEVNACSDRVEALTGARPTLFRCPYGEYDDHVIEAIRALGVTPIQWDVERSQTR